METRTLSVEYDRNTAVEFRRADVRFAILDTTITSVFTLYQFGNGSRQSDSLTLVKLYNDCDGRRWTTQWDMSLPMDKWKGVTLETTPAGIRVTSLDLTGAGLSGTFPAYVCDLSYLRNLWLGDNSLTGQIPADIDRLQMMQYLYLYGNKLTGQIPASIGNMTSLMRLHLYSNENPNNVYSLLRTFFAKGGPEFHTLDGSGYQLWIETVLNIDSFNPQVSARLARTLENWRRYEPRLSSMMYKALRYVSQQKNLSADLREIVDKAINEPI